jgi:hypothetical protein
MEKNVLVLLFLVVGIVLSVIVTSFAFGFLNHNPIVTYNVGLNYYSGNYKIEVLTIKNICDRVGVFTLFFYPPYSSKNPSTQNLVTSINLVKCSSERYYLHDYCWAYFIYTYKTPVTWKFTDSGQYFTISCTVCTAFHKFFVIYLYCSFPPDSLSRLYYSCLRTSAFLCTDLCYFSSTTSQFYLTNMGLYTISTFISSTSTTRYCPNLPIGSYFYTSLFCQYLSCVIISSFSNQICIIHKTMSTFTKSVYSQVLLHFNVDFRCVLFLPNTNHINPTPEYRTCYPVIYCRSLWTYTVYRYTFIECLITVFTPASVLPCSGLVGFFSSLTFTGSCTILTLTIPLCYTGFIEVLENGESMIQIPLD